MNFLVRTHGRGIGTVAAVAFVLTLAPRSARAFPLLEEQLSLDDSASHPVLRIALAAQERAKDSTKPRDDSLDFDLLGKPPPVVQVDDKAMHRRRSMLQWHQGIGIGLYALQLSTTVVGQLNYSDKYGSSAPRTAQYEMTHGALAFTTLGVFLVNGTIALLTPAPKPKVRHGFDRVSLHKLGMGIATAGMVAQGATGIYANSREGYLNQDKWAKTHLAIGYATFAAMTVAVGALVF